MRVDATPVAAPVRHPTDSQLLSDCVRVVTRLLRRLRKLRPGTSLAGPENLQWAKTKAGVQDVAFAKKCGLKVSDMVRSSWIYKQLRRLRAGIEGIISFLKRVFGADRCTWKGWRRFRRYVHMSVVSFDLLVLARLKLAQ